MNSQPCSLQTASNRNDASRIMIALDYADVSAAYRLLEQISGIPCYLKVGMQLFYAAGPDFIKELKQRGHRVFLDLKLHDIPNTVRGAAESITRLGVDMFNVHAAGGRQMMEAALQGVKQGMQARAEAAEQAAPLVIAVTQLTSTNLQTLNEEIGIPGAMEDAVLHYARLAQKAGMAGVVASPLEVKRIKEGCGTDFITVTPGIRPAGAELGDQSRVMTPEQAFAAGSDYIVIGRPITAAADPKLVLSSIIDSFKS